MLENRNMELQQPEDVTGESAETSKPSLPNTKTNRPIRGEITNVCLCFSIKRMWINILEMKKLTKDKNG